MNPNNLIKVTIVDDHDLIRKCLQELLNHWRYTVISQAANGKDFLDLLVKGIIPDICILDMRMPEMDGYETTKVVKEKWPEIKIIAYSMDFKDPYAQQPKGADAIVSKSSPYQELQEALALLSTQIVNNYNKNRTG
jgi:DNA-binding NarL/FixJ family response regulator